MARTVARRAPTAAVEPDDDRSDDSPDRNLPAEIPDYLKDYSGPSGTEGLSSEDVATPRVQVMQGLSPELELHDNLKAGDLFHSGAEANLGREVEIIPLAVVRSYTLWRPRPEGGILARSHDGVNWDRVGRWTGIKLKNVKEPVTWEIRDKSVIKSGLAEWGSSNPADPDSQPAAVLSYNIAAMFPGRQDELGPAVIRLQRAGVKTAKKLLGRLKAQRWPIWALRMPLTTIQEQGPEGPYWQLKFGKFTTIMDAALAMDAQALFNNFQTKGVVLAEVDEPDEDDLGLDDDIAF